VKALRRDKLKQSAGQDNVKRMHFSGLQHSKVPIAGHRHDAARSFVDFWSGEGSYASLPLPAQASLARRVDKVPFDFRAVRSWPRDARELRVSVAPTLLLTGSRESHSGATRACSHYPQPIGDEREVDEGDEHEIELLEAREDAPESFESTEQPFDLIAPLVPGAVVLPGGDATLFGWDYRDKAEVECELPGLVAFVGTVHDQMQRPGHSAQLA